MKPLITTVHSVRELATGLAPKAIPSSPVLFQAETVSASYLIHADDTLESQRIILIREENSEELDVPDSLSTSRRDVLSRMASFAERARTRPLSLPRGWHQYKYHNLVAFFATPKGDNHSTRWITEVLPGEKSDVVFWTATTSDSKEELDGFSRSFSETVPRFDLEWAQIFPQALKAFDDARQAETADVDMYLPPLTQSPSKTWSYDQWLEAVSDDQRDFINAPTGKSIRLRGPAGSGKTLALTLKAMKEVLRARIALETTRVLIVTHSWALASQISDSIDSMGVGHIGELEVFPLLEIARSISPSYATNSADFTVVGEDSFSGKQAQLDEIVDLIGEFAEGDWITYRSTVSDSFKKRLDSVEDDDRKALAWDLLTEFGSVIGAAAIFPGAGSESRYFQLSRAPWMLPLNSRADLRVVFHLYTQYMDSLDARSLVSSDQVLADFLSHLETHAWNRARKTDGYDLVFVDEFHLFSPLERQVLHYLTRDVTAYPRIFMAVDPRQSPSEAFIGIAADEALSSQTGTSDDQLGEIDNFELTTVHRFSPQILNLVKHIHHEFPTYNLGHHWDIDFSKIESATDAGPLPRLISCGSPASEEIDIYRAVQDLYSNGRLALAIIDTRQWRRFSDLATNIARSAKFHAISIAGKSDIEGVGYRRRGLVVGPAEYLAGLQFETVLVAGLPNLNDAGMTANERNRLLSLLYLGISRAQREVRVFVNDDDGGAAEVLVRAVSNGLMKFDRGSPV